MHKRCFVGKPFTFTDVMTKLYACGLTLDEIVYGATAKPAGILGFDGWTDFSALCKHGTLFSFRPNSEQREFFDGFGNMVIPEKVFRAEAVIVDGNICPCDDRPPVVDIG
jgi:dihydroorotase